MHTHTITERKKKKGGGGLRGSIQHCTISWSQNCAAIFKSSKNIANQNTAQYAQHSQSLQWDQQPSEPSENCQNCQDE